jgi:uncharacterized protein (TIGR02145 family)
VGSGSFCYVDRSNCIKYGRLYSWEAAKKAAPPGWHLPSKSDWETLLNDLGNPASVAYAKLITGGSSRFNALLGGWQDMNGRLFNYETRGGFWSTSDNGTYTAFFFLLNSDNQQASLATIAKNNFLSLRCIKD